MRAAYTALGLEFDINERWALFEVMLLIKLVHNRFVARQNQRVTEAIMERITNESQVYDTKVIKSKFVLL